uniref:Mediator of RNA polymerase II transcription subunit 6 n=1 Tax=Rhodosorus marinus TaxID=101924 RepID=A0A7S2ZXB0_9RHOD|mmetsp:Transcript_33917/g.133103  ORF Transcript_33917/g.133103 Transcript_33917/m.133103 type:complete len:233 (+) Transcript_33917:92-790(+)|eukprot:CAMPEP_0113956266 /NCGR_PEP_ID=MMETSP0011_2-20120614/1945_1 /TAXON_ID=101924 /ORGANISM="Rhodosorus marinus" /LENGTH=232 /DNA_ID=CAMNT_0000966351 /DNA_START=32 /DNA_END=730 /DNA_ORIENTATION=+ /assembly_acc=CAM_ASM_000156
MGEESLTSLSWNDKVWLSYFPLDKDTVLEYFARSPFYNRSCLNEQYKMQRLEISAFENVPGILYEVVHDLTNEPLLFVIAKLERAENLTVRTLAYYYIMNGVAYESPKAHSVLTTRIVQSMYHLRNAFDALQEKIPSEQGDWYSWKPSYGSSSDAGDDKDESEAAIVERQTVDRLLYGILERNRRVMKETVRADDRLVKDTAAESSGRGNNVNQNSAAPKTSTQANQPPGIT